MTSPDPAQEAAESALERLIAYVRGNYAPASPTARLLAAYEAQHAELERLRGELTSYRLALSLSDMEPTEAQVEARRAAADEERH